LIQSKLIVIYALPAEAASTLAIRRRARSNILEPFYPL
jgi:hypothetical protein